jgi:hypothetical protein
VPDGVSEVATLFAVFGGLLVAGSGLVAYLENSFDL